MSEISDRQSMILSAAIKLFSEKGYEATATKEIAKLAKVAEGTIFRYYKTKKDILLAIPDFLAELPLTKTLLNDIQDALIGENITVENFLRRIIINRIEFSSKNLSVIKILIQEVGFHPELREKILEKIFFPTMVEIEKVIERFKKRELIKEIPDETIIKLIYTSVIGYFFFRNIAMIISGEDEERETEFMINYIMHGICKP